MTRSRDDGQQLLDKKKTVRMNGVRGGGAGGRLRGRGRHHRAPDPAAHRDADDGARAQMVANGELDAEYIVADSEHSQLSIAHGAASSGARVFTGSSGRRRPVRLRAVCADLGQPHAGVQMMIADRTLDPPGDFGSEHTDALSTRDMGWLDGLVCDGPEAFDNHLMAFRIGEDPSVLLPQMVCQDGFFVSHIHGEVRAAGPRTGQGIPAAVQTSLSARSAPSGVALARRSCRSRARRSARAARRAGHDGIGGGPGHREVHEQFARIARPPLRPLGRRIHDRRTPRSCSILQGAHGVAARTRSATCASAGQRSACVRLTDHSALPRPSGFADALSTLQGRGRHRDQHRPGQRQQRRRPVRRSGRQSPRMRVPNRPLVFSFMAGHGRRGDRPEGVLLDDAERCSRRRSARQRSKTDPLGGLRGVGLIQSN